MLFLTDVGLAVAGAGSHARRKVDLLGELSGERVTVVDLSPQRSRRYGRALLAVARLRCGGTTPVAYARIAPVTLPVVLIVCAVGGRVIGELNGFVADDPRSWSKRAATRWMFRLLARSSRVLFVGDDAYRGYAESLAGRGPGAVRWATLPLGTPRTQGIDAADGAVEPVVRFVGTFGAWQGLEVLLDAWEQLDAPEWRLEIIGSGPLEAQLRARAAGHGRVTIGPAVLGPAYETALATAGVLVAPYPAERGAEFPLSALKTVDYCLTRRPVVLAERDVLVPELAGCGPEVGLRTTDGTAPGTTAAIRSAIELAHGRPLDGSRATLVLDQRGPEVQRRRLAAILTMAGVGGAPSPAPRMEHAVPA